MMKTTGRVTSCCVALFLVLTSVSAVQRLDSINDLKEINFGQSVPKHSLVLLHWFANTVDITNTDDIQLTFDPIRDYGSHYYGNFEEVLDPLTWGYRYYTIGNLYQNRPLQLPSYVVHAPTGYEGRNRDRIIIRVREQRIDQVYITQHYEHQNTYDPDHTYQIATNLLRQIRQFSLGGNHQRLLYLRNRFGSNTDVSHIRNTWGHLACLGLLLFIVIEEKYSSNQPNNRPQNRHNYWDDDATEMREEMRGSNVPRYCQNQNEKEVFFDDDEDDGDSRIYRSTGNRQSGNDNQGRLCCCIFCFIFIGLMLGFMVFYSIKKRI